MLDHKLSDPNSLLDLEALQFLHPVTACINRLWFQILMMVFSLLLFIDAYETSKTFSSYGTSTFKSYKLQMQVYGSSSLNASLVKSIPTFQGNLTFLQGDCPVSSLNFTFTPSSLNIASISFVDVLEINGFSLSLSDSIHNLTATVGFHILLKGSMDVHPLQDWSWSPVGQATDLRKVCRGVRFLDTENANLFLTGHADFDLRAPWPLFVESTMSSLLLCVGCSWVALLGFRRHHALARAGLLTTLVALAANAAIASVGYVLLGLLRESIAPIFDVCIFSLLAMAVLAEELFFKALVALAGVGLLGCYVQDCLAFSDCSYLTMESPRPSQFLCFAAVGLAFLALRKLDLICAVGAVVADAAGREAQWAALRKLPGADDTLRCLAAATALMTAACRPGESRQYNRLRRREPLSDTASGSAPPPPTTTSEDGSVEWPESTVAGTADRSLPVASLDQLYVQVGFGP